MSAKYLREFGKPGEQHHHGCLSCRGRYCCACKTPEVNSTCNPCNSGFPTRWQEAWSAKACCYGNTKLCTKEQRKAYRLAGPGPWFICKTCARTFPTEIKEIA